MILDRLRRGHHGVAGVDDGEVTLRHGLAVDLDGTLDHEHRPLGVLCRKGEAGVGVEMDVGVEEG